MIDRRRARRLSEIKGGHDGVSALTYSSHRDHLFTACHFAKLARRLELRAASRVTPDAVSRHRAYVTATIGSSVAFLESSINELYSEFRNGAWKERPGRPGRVYALLAVLWPSVESSNVISRYQVALDAADAERFNRRRAPLRDVESLIMLRDALVHAHPEKSDERRRHYALQQRLRDRFPPSGLIPPRAAWFPDLCLGAGCAEWAFRTAKTFSDEFSARMSIPARGSASLDQRRRTRPRIPTETDSDGESAEVSATALRDASASGL